MFLRHTGKKTGDRVGGGRERRKGKRENDKILVIYI